MEFKQIKQVVEMMKQNDLSEFAYEQGEFKLKIRRGKEGAQATAMPTLPPGYMAGPPMEMASAPARPATAEAAARTEAEEPGVETIKSPMVGTFYRAPSPESTPFVDEGSQVTEETVVCIVEAMKVMNEIQAETRGRIVGILVENGDSVEYGQPLFKVKKA